MTPGCLFPCQPPYYARDLQLRKKVRNARGDSTAPRAPLIPASRRSFAFLQDVLLLHTAVPSRLCPLIRPVCPRPLHMANSSPSDKTWTLSRGVPDERGSPLPLFRGALHRGPLALITRSCSVRPALHLQPPLGTRNPLRTDIKPLLFAVPEVSRGDTEA